MSRLRRILLVFVISVLVASIASFTLIPNAVSDALVARWLASSLEHPVTVEGFRVRGLSRATCDALRIGNPSPFSEATLLDLEGVTLDRANRVQAERGRARVERKSDGSVSLRKLVESRSATDGTSPFTMLCDSFEIESIDAATGARVTLHHGSLVLAREPEQNRLTLTGRVGDEGDDRPFELRFEQQRSTGDAVCSLQAADLDLSAVATIAHAFDPSISASGKITSKLEVAVADSANRIAISGTLRGSEFSLLIPSLDFAEAIGERSIAFDGSVEIDRGLGRVTLAQVKLDSQALAMTGDGTLSYRGELRCDLDLEGALNLDRAALKYGSAIARFTPLRSLRGTLSFRVDRSGGAPSKFDLQGEYFTLGLANGRIIDPGDFQIDGTFETHGDSIRYPTFHFDTRFLELRGVIDLEHAIGPSRSTGRFDLSGELRADKFCEPVLQATIPLQLQMVGDVQVRIFSQWDEDSLDWSFQLAGPRFGAHYDQQVGKALVQYDFFGSPFEMSLGGSCLRSVADFAESLSAEGTIKAGQVKILRDEMENLELPIQCERGKLRLGPFRSDYNGGSLSGVLELTFAGVAEPTLGATFDLANAQLRKTMPHRVAAMTTGVFVGELAPFRIETDCVANGRFEGKGRGRSIVEMLQTLNGAGELSIGKGTVKGSRLLAALAANEAGLDTPLAIDSIQAPFATRDGITTASPVKISFEGRTLELTSVCDSIGAIRVVVRPEDFLGSALFRRVSKQLPNDAIQILGFFDEPKFQLPDARAWSEMNAESLASAVERFLGNKPQN